MEMRDEEREDENINFHDLYILHTPHYTYYYMYYFTILPRPNDGLDYYYSRFTVHVVQ